MTGQKGYAIPRDVVLVCGSRVSMIADAGLSGDIPLKRGHVGASIHVDTRFPSDFPSAELLYAVYTNTTSLVLVHSFCAPFLATHRTRWPHHIQERGVFQMIARPRLVNGAPPLSKPGLPVRQLRVTDARMISDLCVGGSP